MSADDLRHRAHSAVRATAGIGEHEPAGTGRDVTGFATVAARVPPEYRDAYLEGFARVRAGRDETAA